MSQREPTGNTRTVGSQHQLYRWCATIKEDCIKLSQLSQIFKEFCKKYTFQLEEGENGYRHWQCVFSLKEKLRFPTVKNLFPQAAHIEPCRDWFGSRAYCSKEDSRVQGPYTERSLQISTITELREWQSRLLTRIREEPDDRTILWFTDVEGGAGKTAFTKYLVVHHGAMAFTNAKTSDIAYAMPSNCRIVVFNFTRTVEGRINTGAIESVKDGMLFSGKYESKLILFNSPWVIVFANFDPDRTTLSQDRWEIIQL